MKRTAISRRPSKAKREFDAEYAAVLPSVLVRGCEFKDHYARSDSLPFDAAALPFVLPCNGRLVGHHAKGRRSLDSNNPSNLRCLCDKHHVFVHAHSRWAREVGLMLSRVS